MDSRIFCASILKNLVAQGVTPRATLKHRYFPEAPLEPAPTGLAIKPLVSVALAMAL